MSTAGRYSAQLQRPARRSMPVRRDAWRCIQGERRRAAAGSRRISCRKSRLLHRSRTSCLIVDEVQTGIGRTGDALLLTSTYGFDAGYRIDGQRAGRRPADRRHACCGEKCDGHAEPGSARLHLRRKPGLLLPGGADRALARSTSRSFLRMSVKEKGRLHPRTACSRVRQRCTASRGRGADARASSVNDPAEAIGLCPRCCRQTACSCSTCRS